MSGKVIVITGGPRTGKSTLVQLLSQKLTGQAFLEGEEKDLPARILEDIKLGHRNLELILWFRNKCVQDYIKALEIKRKGGIAILDTFWVTNDVYIDEWIADDFEKDVFKNLAEIDNALLIWPDLVLSLYSDQDRIRKLAVAGGREFELNDEFLQKQVDLNNTHESYFRKLDKPNIKFVDVSESDYLNQKQQLDDLIVLVKECLKM